jgi:predicted NBD/HSP70 family sugar kinase
VSKAREFESRVIERLRAIGTSISQQRDVDLIISFKGKKIAVELKWAPPSPTKLISIIKQMEKSLTNYGSDEGLIVIGSPVSDQIRNMSIGRVRIISVDEFFNLLTAPEPLRGAS